MPIREKQSQIIKGLNKIENVPEKCQSLRSKKDFTQNSSFAEDFWKTLDQSIGCLTC